MILPQDPLPPKSIWIFTASRSAPFKLQWASESPREPVKCRFGALPLDFDLGDGDQGLVLFQGSRQF